MKQRAILMGGAALVAASSPANAGTVTITITDLRNTNGNVMACMTTKQSVFPKCRRDPNSHRTVVKAADGLSIRFDDVQPGEYAIAILHDENGDGKANRVLGMAPKEGYGFSRDAPVKMAPPNWDDAVFTVTDTSQKIAIKMRYFL